MLTGSNSMGLFGKKREHAEPEGVSMRGAGDGNIKRILMGGAMSPALVDSYRALQPGSWLQRALRQSPKAPYPRVWAEYF